MDYFKKNLLNILYNIEEREKSPMSTLQLCVDGKLRRSYKYYEDNLKETCSYILSRNPITILKGMNSVLLKEEEDE